MLGLLPISPSSIIQLLPAAACCSATAGHTPLPPPSALRPPPSALRPPPSTSSQHLHLPPPPPTATHTSRAHTNRRLNYSPFATFNHHRAHWWPVASFGQPSVAAQLTPRTLACLHKPPCCAHRLPMRPTSWPDLLPRMLLPPLRSGRLPPAEGWCLGQSLRRMQAVPASKCVLDRRQTPAPSDRTSLRLLLCCGLQARVQGAIQRTHSRASFSF
jgi:hypothetical protein